ncbi:MAG TPA: hypothetical protein VN541_11045, partial [Tepidisphaeraceae bacterium]|nr:hypothetical protein [Tepidisphaeraceae bacterium]
MAYQARETGSEHLDATYDAIHLSLLDVDANAQINRGDQILIRDLVQHSPAAMGIGAAKDELSIKKRASCGLRRNIAHSCSDLGVRHYPADHPLRNVHLGFPDIRQ